MKRCPKCNREYTDDSLRFCLDDGSPLFSSHDLEAPPTEIMSARGGPTLKGSGPTIQSYSAEPLAPVQPPVTRTAGSPLLTGGVIAIALLLVALVAIAGVFLLRQSGIETAHTNQSSNPTNRDNSAVNRPSPEVKPTPVSREETTTTGSQTGPLKITPSASSVRMAVQSNTYNPANAIDGKRSTAWIEGVDGPGIGEWIRFDFDREINLHRLVVDPGYFKSPEIWAENNRLASVTIYFSDGSSRDLTFEDQMKTQRIELGSIKTRWVKLVIKSVYYGSDPDTALSEITFEWD